LRIVIQSAAGDGSQWRRALAGALPEASLAVWPECSAAVDYALVWKPPPELFASPCARARAIFNLGAGVDSLLAVPGLPPQAPLVRLEDAGMAAQMAEYVTLAVLGAYRGSGHYDAAQREARWSPRRRRAKADFRVGLLGLGVLGCAVADALRPFGFPLAGWSRTRKAIADVRSYAGADELPALLSVSNALVCLLPSTPATRNLLDRARLRQLPAGATLVNVARGDIIVDDDLLALLDEGHLAQATLDVFRTEPLPAAHPFWRHPRIAVTPHVSAQTLVEESVAQIADKIRRLERGLPITGVIDRALGY
jgi:glyoxylate/hydroxypyruvate reductase A